MWDHLRFPACFIVLGMLLSGIEGNGLENKVGTISTRIHRGFTARRGDYLFTAWIRTGTRTYHCAASLVSDEWVMTAASCVEDKVVENYKIYLGDYKIKREDGEIIVDPDRIVLHPDYVSGLVGNDVAMLHLATKVDLETATVATLPNMFDGNMTMDALGRQECLICGWGKKKNGKMNKRKQFLPIKIEDGSKCSNHTAFENETCVCYTGDPGAPCQADRGSPIVCLIDDVWTQLGVQSDGSCDPGFHFGAKVSAVRSWVETIAFGLDCPDPPSIPNGKYFEIDGGNGNDKVAVLVCNDSFTPASINPLDLFITCLDNNQWSSNRTTCIPDSQGCPAPPTIPNGKFFEIEGGSGNDKLAVLVCNEGYSPNSTDSADTIITCQDDNQWSSPKATCVLDSEDCGSPPTIANGIFYKLVDSDGQYFAKLVCNSGFRPSSSDQSDTIIVCMDNGQWSDSTVSCVKDTQDCPEPPTVQNGKYIPFQGGDGKTRAVLICDSNYKPSSDDITIVCLDTGQWSTSTVTCISDSQDCPDPPSISKGQYFEISNNGDERKAILLCDTGYSPSSDDTQIVCQSNGQWSSSSTVCVKDNTDCPDPPSISKGKYVEISNDGDERKAILLCDTGYSPSSDDTQIVCQCNGQWSSSNTVCLKDDTGCSSIGTSFMFGFPRNYNGAGVPYMYTITTEPVTVTVSVPFLSSVKSYSFTRAAIWFFDKNIFGGRNEELAGKGIEVKSTKPITVFAHQYESSNGRSAEGTLVFPEDCASSEYIAVTHNMSPGSTYKSNLMIIGTRGGTSVELQLPNGHKRQVTLGRFGTYHYTSQDLSGAVVRASAKVIVMAGHECANVPNHVAWCDHLLEQLPPLSSLQSTYILTYMKPRPHYSFRIVAPYSNTVVNIWDRNGKLLDTVNLGSTSTYFNNVFFSQTISITANKGILVAQYGHGTYSDNLGYGDPSMVIHPSLNQFVNFYYLFCPTDFYKKNWVAVVIKATYTTSGLRLNNSPLSGKQYISVNVPGNGDYKVIHIRLYEKVNLLTHTDGNAKFGAWQYGFNSAVEYSWIAGRIV